MEAMAKMINTRFQVATMKVNLVGCADKERESDYKERQGTKTPVWISRQPSRYDFLELDEHLNQLQRKSTLQVAQNRDVLFRYGNTTCYIPPLRSCH